MKRVILVLALASFSLAAKDWVYAADDLVNCRYSNGTEIEPKKCESLRRAFEELSLGYWGKRMTKEEVDEHWEFKQKYMRDWAAVDDTCGRSVDYVEVGMSFARAQKCAIGSYSLVGKKRTRAGLVSTYEHEYSDTTLDVVNGVVTRVQQ